MDNFVILCVVAEMRVCARKSWHIHHRGEIRVTENRTSMRMVTCKGSPRRRPSQRWSSPFPTNRPNSTTACLRPARSPKLKLNADWVVLSACNTASSEAGRRRRPLQGKDSSWGAKRRFFGVLHAHSRSPNSQFNDGERFVPLPSISGDVKVVRAETTRHLHVCAMKVRVAKPARMRDVDPSPLFHWFFYISKEVTSLKFIAVIQYGKNDRKIELHRDLAKIKIMNDLQKRPSA